jgi:hypothetical protein
MKTLPIVPVKKPSEDYEDPHVKMSKIIAQELSSQSYNKPRKLISIPLNTATRNKKIALFLAPMWGPQVAPYGIAKMAGLSRYAGYETRCWDINIKSYAATNGELWNKYWDWKWDNTELFYSDIVPMIIPILEQFIKELIEYKPDIIGMTLYYTNKNCSYWIINRIRQSLPQAKIVVGGPEARHIGENSSASEFFDYVVRGEGEQNWLSLLETIEADKVLPKFLDDDRTIRLDLDKMPIPDYRDFDITLYQFKGIAAEISRGCIAKCTFCNETTFWKYRGRKAVNLLDEVEYNYHYLGIEFVWFIDSLINGDLEELLTFAQGLLKRKIKVRWWGFARNDSRMDRNYLKTLLQSGCMGFHMGVESGSQHIVDLINKKVKIADIEQNFNDLAELGSFITGTSWFVGFPGEKLTDVAQTLTLIWRLRNAGISGKGFGICNLDTYSPLNTQREKYNISYNLLGGQWYTNDLTNTVAHRIIRYKSANILLNHYRLHGVRNQLLGKQGDNLSFMSSYFLNYSQTNWKDLIEFDYNFDYEIIKSNINPFADSLVNEIWPLLRILWLAMGSFDFAVNFSPELDYPAMGDFKYFKKDTGGLWALYKFNIDSSGVWSADFTTKVVINGFHQLHLDFDHQYSGSGHWTR